jgi:hypothetical protein
MGHLIPSPSDCSIQVNTGGRNFETTTMTLMSSGSKLLYALLGPTGITLAGGEASIQAFDQSPLFLDRDPDLVADILFFMQSNRLAASTRRNVDQLEDLQAEANLFVYDALQPCSNKPVCSLKFCSSRIVNRCRLIGACMKRSDVVTTTT